MASLKDTIAKKDDEIEQLELLKEVKNEYPGSLRSGNSSASDDFSGVNPHRTQKPSIRKGMGNETASYQESNPEHSDRHSEAGSQQSKLSERDRLSDISDGALSVGEEPDGETDQGTKLSNKLRK